MNKKLTQDQALDLFRYDPETGYLHWRKSNTNSVKVGDRAGGYHNSTGYIRIRACGERYAAHRVVWLIIYGEWPSDQLDHINHIRHDNRVENLREATNQENGRNKSLQANNIYGLPGVYWHKYVKKWQARIHVDGRDVSYGLYVEWFDAVCARKTAEAECGFHANHGR